MLNVFRNRGLANAVYGVIIVAIILVFVIQFRPDSGKKTASCNRVCRVTVRGSCVENKEYYASLRLLQNLRVAGRSQEVQDGLIERELLIGEAERLGIAASDKELNEQIVSGFARISLPADSPLAQAFPEGMEGILGLNLTDPKTKEFDTKGYKQKLRQQVGLTEADFREMQKRELLAAKVRDMVRSFVRVSDVEAYQGYVGEQTTATVDYVTIRDAFIKRWGVHVKSDDAAAWAAKNGADVDKAFDKQKETDLPKADRVRHILVMFQGETPEAKHDALRKISEIAARIKQGESFPEVAREVSEDPGSKEKGGKYDKEETKDFQKPWLDEAERLKPGEVSTGVVATTFGYHLLMKDDPAKTEADLAPAIKKGIGRLLFIDAETKRVAKEYAAKVAAAMKGGKSGDDAVKEAFADFGKAPPKADKPDKTPPAPLLAVLNPDPAPAESDAGSTTAATDAGTPKGADAGAKATPPAKEALTPETDPDRPRAQTSPPLTREADAVSGLTPPAGDAFMDFAFAAKDKEVRDEPLEGLDGLVVVALKERHLATKEDFEKAKKADTKYFKDLLRAKQAEALSLYMRQLRETADRAREISVPPTVDGGDQAGEMGNEDDNP